MIHLHCSSSVHRADLLLLMVLEMPTAEVRFEELVDSMMDLGGYAAAVPRCLTAGGQELHNTVAKV